MTDFERAKSMYDDFGITYKITDNDLKVNPEGKTLCCISHTEKVKGYRDFVSELVFDEAGKFIEMGIWE